MTSAARILVVLIALIVIMSGRAAAQDDPYEQYVRTSRDFQRVKQDADWLWKAFASWSNMPWPTGTWRELKKAVVLSFDGKPPR